MTKPPSLNEIYQAINLALGIERLRQFDILQSTKSPQSKTFISGFSRHPEDNRYRHVKHAMLIEYCLALASQPDLVALGVHQDLNRLVRVISNGGILTWKDIKDWEYISLRQGRGKIKDRLRKSRDSIRP